MKRFLAAIAALVLLCCTAVPVLSADVLKVGDPMPTAESFRMRFVERMYTAGYVLRTYITAQYETKVHMAFALCNGLKASQPFGMCIFEGDDAVVYLDNAPTDGVIDEVLINPHGRQIGEDLPECS